jgi:hypothetical protein
VVTDDFKAKRDAAAKDACELKHPGYSDYYYSESDNLYSFKAGADWGRAHTLDKHTEQCEKLQQELAELRTAYNERGMAMQQTGKMVRSMYAPENERLNKENGIMEKALRLILDEVGTSTLTNKIASEALDKIKRIRNGN